MFSSLHLSPHTDDVLDEYVLSNNKRKIIGQGVLLRTQQAKSFWPIVVNCSSTFICVCEPASGSEGTSLPVGVFQIP